MDNEKSLDKFLGSVIGAAVGDAVGAPMEFWDADKYDRIYGGDWVDDMYDFHEMKTHPLGLLRLLSGLDLHMNSKRKPARRYDAVFVENEKSAGKFQKHFTGILDIFTVGAKEGFASFVKKTADGIKEKTKEYVNAQM